MTYEVASQLPILLVTGFVGQFCSICDNPITDVSHFRLRLPLVDGALHMELHKHCARRNGFGTDLDRVLVGANGS